ncbi:uncharacterized protein [Primulina huaijiensis]|uniref:uncharacterized protein n=1 Tax=Primulina huaijiensis TaxID=1492673 RepID=UPI003CC70AC2
MECQQASCRIEIKDSCYVFRRAFKKPRSKLQSEKANVVADALSRNTAVITQLLAQRPLQAEIQRFELAVYARREAHNLSTMSVRTTLRDKIREGQSSDELLQKWRLRDESKGRKLYSEEDRIVRFRDRVWVPIGDSLRDVVMKEAHNTSYSIHPGSTKMNKDLQTLYWWPGAKQDILCFGSECLTCQQVKVEY